MRGAPVDPAELLSELAKLPEERRGERLRSAGNPDELILRLADEAQRLTFVEVSAALAAGEMLVALADRGASCLARARVRRTRAQALAYCGRFQDALRECEEASRIAAAGGETVEAARARLAAMHPLGELGMYEQALAAGEAARTALLAANQPVLAAKADLNLGGVHQNRDDPARALYHLDRAAASLVGEPLLLGHIENNRGEALLLLNDFGGAHAAFTRALNAYELAKANLAAAIAEGNLADLAARRGQLHTALYHFERARRRLEADTAETHLARLLAEQAEALAALGLADDALRAYEEVLPKLEQHNLTWEAARARTGLATSLLKLSRHDEAEAALERAADEFSSLRHSAARARVELLRAELALRQGQPSRARQFLQQAAQGLPQRPADQALLHVRRARVARAEGDAVATQREVDAAVAAAREIDAAPLLADALHERGGLKLAQGRYREAIVDLGEAVTQIERVRGALQADRLRTAFQGDRLRIYEDLVRALLDSGGVAERAESFHVVEQAKSRALLDLVRGATDLDDASQTQLDHVETDLAERAGRLRSELNILYTRLADLPGARQGMSTAAWRAAVNDRERELADLERRLATARGPAHLFGPPARLADVQRLLPAGTALLEYFLIDDELVALLVSNAGLEVARRLATRGQIDAAVERLQLQLGRASRPSVAGQERDARLLADAQRELGALRLLLLAPFESQLAALKRLTVVPHAGLHRVPFHALWDGQRYLIEQIEINHSLSASLLVQTPARTVAAGGGALVVGVCDELAPHMRSEAICVQQSLGNARALLDSAATVEQVLAAAPHARVLHFACHGRFSSAAPHASGLRLADRWLTPRDIYGMRLQAEMVVLSGCSTGLSLVQGGDELQGLLRAFLAAGARRLLASLWPVRDDVALQMMKKIYGRWGGETANMGASLREVQLETMRQHPHPVFWAAFVLVGEP